MPALTAMHHDASGRWYGLLGYLALAALAAGYGRGVHELWLRRGRGAVVPTWRVVAFLVGLAAPALTLSPWAHAAAEGSFAAHMAQNMLLLVVAGPLLAAGGAGLPLAVAARPGLRRLAGRLRHGPLGGWARIPARRAVVAGVTHTAVVLGWHLPEVYQATMRSELLHAAQMACFVGAAWLLWSCVLSPGPHRLPGPAGLLLIFCAGMPPAGLGVLLAIASAPLYPAGLLTPSGGDPLTAQQLGGVVMWAPMEVAAIVLAVAVFLRTLGGLDRRLPAGRRLAPADPLAAPPADSPAAPPAAPPADPPGGKEEVAPS